VQMRDLRVDGGLAVADVARGRRGDEEREQEQAEEAAGHERGFVGSPAVPAAARLQSLDRAAAK
jgi:hypothetical protein